MNELSALRRLVMSSASACAVLYRRARGTNAGIVAALSDKRVLVAAIAAAHRISASDVDRLIAPLITSDTPNPEPTPADLEHIRFMKQHG